MEQTSQLDVYRSANDGACADSPSAHARRCRIDEAPVCLCPVCVSLRSGEGRFLPPVSEQPEGIVAAAESIVDSLGFCDYHGSLLSQIHGQRAAMASALRAATDRMITWLCDESHYADRLFELFFAVEQTCVGCKLRDQRLARAVHQASDRHGDEPVSGALCFPHYRKLAYALKSPSLPGLADAQLRLLQRVTDAIGPLAGEEASARFGLGDVAGATLRWALGVVAGEAAVLLEPVAITGSGAAEALDRRSEERVRCPVCAEICQAELRWADTVKVVARFGQDLWTALPTCPAHIASCARLGDHDIALLAVRYAARVQTEALRTGVVALAHDNTAREAAKQSVFYHRKSPAYILGQQRKMITKIPRCPACERMVIAQERAVGDLVRKLGDARRRNVTGALRDLCLKHFASVYAFVWKSETRVALVSAQIDTLRGLTDRLSRAIDADGSSAIDEGIAEAMRVWQTAVPRPPGHG
jgi:hypothetical protein